MTKYWKKAHLLTLLHLFFPGIVQIFDLELIIEILRKKIIYCMVS